ncbi:Serine/threonine-protein phosphatase UIS2 [Dirofilaria immitis]
MTKATCLLMVIWSMILLAYRTESQYASRRGFYVDHNRGDLYMRNFGVINPFSDADSKRIRFDNSRELPKRYFDALAGQSLGKRNSEFRILKRSNKFRKVSKRNHTETTDESKVNPNRSVVHPRDVMMSLWCHSEYEYDNPESCYLPSHRSFCVQSLSRENFPAQIFNELEAYDQHASI